MKLSITATKSHGEIRITADEPQCQDSEELELLRAIAKRATEQIELIELMDTLKTDKDALENDLRDNPDGEIYCDRAR